VAPGVALAREVAVRLDGVTKRFGAITAVSDVTIDVYSGEFLTLLGPSGCGKTTLLNLVAGFLDPDVGDIVIGGERVTDVPTFQRDIGMVFQNYALFPHMTVFENVAFGLRMRKVPDLDVRHGVNEALDIVRLADYGERKPRELSGGQQQRVALARAIVINPQVLLLDEPLSALDKNLRTRMQVELKEIQRRIGITTIFVTHDQSEALSLSDRVAVISNGVIQQISGPDETYRNPHNSFVASFIGDINRIEGTVAGDDGDDVSIDIGSGRRILAPAGGSAPSNPGDSVWLFIRPEALRLVDDDPPESIMGTVQTHVYQGAHIEVYVEVVDIGIIHLRTTDYGVMERWPVGATVNVTVAPGEALLFSRVE
jgi:spermidine/putrescine ABC transporter ATP-binding subunit